MVKRILVLWIGLLVAGLLPAEAQVTGWRAWLFNQADGRMMLVNESGAALDTFTLPLSPGFDMYPRLVAVGHGGSPFAYVAANSSTYQGLLIVAEREVIRAAFTLPLTFASSMEFVADETIFNEDNSALAVGYSLEGGGWGIIVLDLLTGTIPYTIRHDTPTVAILGLEAGFGITPVIRRFSSRTVTFSLIQAGTEGASEYRGYNWNVDTGAISATSSYLSLDSDTLLATGEVVMSLPDARLPNQSDTFIFYQANSLHVYDPTSAARFPFYNAPDLMLYWPHFIQNGELILTSSSDAAGTTRWLVISRSGAEQGRLPEGLMIDDVRGVADGFIYTSSGFIPDGTATALLYVNTRGGQLESVNPTPVWISPTGTNPVIAWVGDSDFSALAAPNYATWSILADPVYTTASISPPIIASPTPLLGVSAGQVTVTQPVVSGFLAVGRLATVRTTEGDHLNVRLQPVIQADNIIGRLSTGTRVTIVDGPRSAGGYTWWKIRTSTGVEGWVVESVDDNGTRLQTLLPG